MNKLGNAAKEVGSAVADASIWTAFIVSWPIRIALVVAFAFLLISFLTCGLAAVIPPSNETQCGLNMAKNMLSVGGFILTWLAAGFEWSLRRVVLVGWWLRPDGAFGIGISIVWTIVRDFVNLVLIGGLIWTALGMILKTGQQAGKFIVQIIVAALLVNFSFFFAGAAIDASDFVSKLAFEQAFGGSIDQNSTFADTRKTGREISDRFMAATRLGSIYDIKTTIDSTNIETVLKNAGDYLIMIMIGFIGLLLFLVAAAIFAIAGGLFFQRFIVLIVILMTSPIGILRFTELPTLSDLGKGWWAALWSQVIFPPVLIVLLAASFKVMESGSKALLGDSDASFLGLFSGPSVKGLVETGGNSSWSMAWSLITIYIIGIGLMYISMKIAASIAKQEPLKVPTAGQFYGTYGKVLKAGMKGGAQVGKMVGNLPVSWIPGLGKFKNFTDFATGGPGRRSLPALTPSGQRSGRAVRGYIAEFNKARDDEARQTARVRGLKDGSILIDGERATAEQIAAEEAKARQLADSTAIALSKVPEGVQRRLFSEGQKVNDEERAGGVTKRDKEDAVQRAKDNQPNIQSIIGRQRAVVPPSAGAAAQQSSAVRGVVDAVNAADSREAARDMLAFRLERKEILNDTVQARELVRGLRAGGNVTLLSPDVLAHKNVAPEINLTELVEIASDTEHVNNEQFDKIADKVSDEVHNAFRAHPASKLRPLQIRRDARRAMEERAKNDRPPEMGPGESMARSK